jgi:hypothetical protein
MSHIWTPENGNEPVPDPTDLFSRVRFAQTEISALRGVEERAWAAEFLLELLAVQYHGLSDGERELMVTTGTAYLDPTERGVGVVRNIGVYGSLQGICYLEKPGIQPSFTLDIDALESFPPRRPEDCTPICLGLRAPISQIMHLETLAA